VPVRHRDWPRGQWLMLEFKRPDGKGKLSPEQEEALVMGDIFVVQSWKEVCDALGIPFSEQLPFEEILP
jgi:hypothetical protein